MAAATEPTHLPPPFEPPLADEADPKLVAFLYLLMRDAIPAGEVEKAMRAAVQSTPARLSNPELAAYADRVARTLTHPTSVPE
jgi:hypothetical protein